MGIKIKKYQAQTIQKAIEMIRADLGDNAIILQTDPIRTPSAFGLITKEGVEVTAAIDRQDDPPRFSAVVGEETQASVQKSQKTGDVRSGWKSLLPVRKQKQSEAQTPTPASARTTVPAADQGAESPFKGRSRDAQPGIGQLYAMKNFVDPIQKEVGFLKEQVTRLSAASQVALDRHWERELKELKTELKGFLLDRRFESLKLPAFCRTLMNFWIDHGVTNRQIFSFFKQIEDWGIILETNVGDAVVGQAVNQGLSRLVREGGQEAPVGARRVVVVVGPTGAGKTTTIAKMAAHEKLRLGRKVSLLTLDDYKIGAFEQLSQMARILEVPCVKVRSDVSLEEQLRFQDADTIFVDTFGISPADRERIQKLEASLNIADRTLRTQTEVHLAMPVSTPAIDIQKALGAFNSLKPDFLLFTKWDETENWGGMLSTILESRKPVSYVTYGQTIPDDISAFSAKEFIKKVTDPAGVEN